MVSLLEEGYNFFELDCLNLVFSLLKRYTSLIYINENTFCLIDYFFMWVSGDPFHAVTMRKYFMHIKFET